MHFFHSWLSKAKNGSIFPLVTGGNWKKSPVMTNWRAYALSLHHRFKNDHRHTCMPPNGRSVFFRRLWAIDERTSNRCPSTIETKT